MLAGKGREDLSGWKKEELELGLLQLYKHALVWAEGVEDSGGGGDVRIDVRICCRTFLK
jgi:hypothetical protein